MIFLHNKKLLRILHTQLGKFVISNL